MDTATDGAVARAAEAEPTWAEVVDRVICDGRPGYLRDAADRYEHLLRRMHDEATSMEDELAELAQSWDGVAFAAYHAVIETVVAETREAANAARAIVDALRLAADLLRGHQERIPVPVRLGGAVFRAHQQRRESAGGVAPSNADFEQAVHADVVEREPWLTAPQALEQANILFLQQQNVARRVYRELSAAYNAVAALLPALPVVLTAAPAAPPPVAVKHGKGHGWNDVDRSVDHDVDRVEDGVIVGVEDGVIGVGEDEVIDLPVPVALGGHDDGTSLPAGRLSRYGDGPLRGAGPADSGASFGVPVSVMNTPGVTTGMGMGTPGINAGMGISTPGMSTPGVSTPGMGSGMGTHMSTHMSTPMGSGYGNVIGGSARVTTTRG